MSMGSGLRYRGRLGGCGGCALVSVGALCFFIYLSGGPPSERGSNTDTPADAEFNNPGAPRAANTHATPEPDASSIESPDDSYDYDDTINDIEEIESLESDEPDLSQDSQFADEQQRSWESESGKFTTVATLVGYDTGNVTLEKPDGSRVTVRTSKLSGADRDYLRERIEPTRIDIEVNRKVAKSSTLSRRPC